jgi:hypothetical protein
MLNAKERLYVLSFSSLQNWEGSRKFNSWGFFIERQNVIRGAIFTTHEVKIPAK